MAESIWKFDLPYLVNKLNEVKGDKNNIAFTHGYTEEINPENTDYHYFLDRYFSFEDTKTKGNVLTISETENSVMVTFNGDQDLDYGVDPAVRELPTKQYVDNAISGAGGASLSIDTIPNPNGPTTPDGPEIKSTITQGANYIEISCNKRLDNLIPNLIYATINDYRIPIPTHQYIKNVNSSIHDTNSRILQNNVRIDALEKGVNALKTEFVLKDFNTTFSSPITIPNVTSDVANTSIPNVDITIEGDEATQYAIAGMVKYEVKNASGQRLNCFPICSFSMNGQTTLRIRMMCAGSSSVQASSINGAILLKRR